MKERGSGGLYGNAAEEVGPVTDRCAPKPGKQVRKGCASVRLEGSRYVRQLSVGDAICLDGGVGKFQVSSLCRVRSSVVDTAPDKVLLEIREAQPGTAYAQRVQHQIWFHDAALVDLYLDAHGYH